MRKVRFLSILVCAIILTACGAPAATPEAADAAAAQEMETPAPAADLGGPGEMLGFIVEDDGQIPGYMMMHGFLRTAENLGYPAKLYRAKQGQEALASVETAIEDGCGALLIQNSGGANDQAVQAAIQAGVYTAVPYDLCTLEGLDCNVVADDTDYIEELARGIAVRMTERNLKSGRILVYGVDTQPIYEKIQAAIGEYYPQFQVVSYERTNAGQAAVDELAAYLLYNRDIKGMYAVDRESAPLSVQARNQANRQFRNEGTPSPTPEPSQLPGTTPAPTPNPGLLTQISITAFGCGLSDENLNLFYDNDIYGLCIEPYYEAAANATMQLDRLLLGEEAEQTMRVNRPIVYGDTMEKYLAIYEEVKGLFGLQSTATPESQA